ncbi:MlaE family ABC transporter permease [Actinomadura rupiterrae]|uniref:MlaE family ABC transporter permease n=1 Tax=Actinomadura rupiterrae TaxID=559627 RepID=UPI0020A29B3B|nr:ABC transporter permease [Actinomadura rupiterrae]MCP2334781.1 phospholipid/cholesterol/gamma-HCH transport system permease protein [Actinomadura rupiterrae]
MALSLTAVPDLARRRAARALDETGLMCVTFLEGIRRTWDVRQWWGEFIEQCWFLARVTSVPVMLIAIPLGATISLQVGDIARQLGAASATGALLIAAMVQQVAPLAAALLVSGVGGSAITSDMGARNIRDELAAMEVMGINPIHRLVTPRLWAASTVSLLLASVVILAGTLGGYYFNVIQQGVSPGAFFDGATTLLQFPDLMITLFKAWVFGFIAAAVACYMGMNCDYGPVGVGRAVNRAVVVTSIVVFASNYVLTTIYQVLFPPRF